MKDLGEVIKTWQKKIFKKLKIAQITSYFFLTGDILGILEIFDELTEGETKLLLCPFVRLFTEACPAEMRPSWSSEASLPARLEGRLPLLARLELRETEKNNKNIYDNKT